MERISGYEPEGYRFKSDRFYHLKMNIAIVNGSNSASKLTIEISQDESDSIRCSAVFFNIVNIA